jgi:hypothetical protein
MRFVQAWDNIGAAPEGWASHVIVQWRDFEPAAGLYRLDHFARALEYRKRPCYVQLGFSFFDKVLGAPVDYSPQAHKRSLKLHAGGLTGEIPPYDERWTEAYCRAVEALAMGLRDYPQVVGYWHAAGWNAETQAAVAHRGVDWAAAAKPLLKSIAYYAFIMKSTCRALEAWGDVPVYLPGAVSPGEVWGTKRRDLIADCLRAGAGYMCCGLASDNSTAVGIGERAGLGMYDIAWEAERRGFEEGQRLSKNEPMELYWMLLRAMHWQADFVNLYASMSAPQVTEVAHLLPADGVRWIVFRDAEYPPVTYTAGGKLYGHGGEPGPWASGIIAADGAQPERGPGFDFARWALDVPGLLVLQLPGAADGDYPVTIWRPDGSREISQHTVAGELLVLPAGRYHRVDVAPAGALSIEARMMRLEERVAALEGARATSEV